MCWGFGANFCECFQAKSLRRFWEATGASSWRGAFIKLDDILLIMAGGKKFGKGNGGRDSLPESESFITQIVLLVIIVFYCQCLIRSCRRKYSQINV